MLRHAPRGVRACRRLRRGAPAWCRHRILRAAAPPKRSIVQKFKRSKPQLPLRARPPHLDLPSGPRDAMVAAAETLLLWGGPRPGDPARSTASARSQAAHSPARRRVPAVSHCDPAAEYLPTLLVRGAVVAAGLQAAQGADVVRGRNGICVGMVPGGLRWYFRPPPASVRACSAR